MYDCFCVAICSDMCVHSFQNLLQVVNVTMTFAKIYNEFFGFT